MPTTPPTYCPSADGLVAIIVAARRSGDRDLERRARRELHDRHGIRLSFATADGPPNTEGRDHD